MKADITPQEYEAFKKFLQDACGILLGDNKQYLVKSRLRRILEENSLNSLGELLERLKRPGRAGLREVVIDDSLGLAEELEADGQAGGSAHGQSPQPRVKAVT